MRIPATLRSLAGPLALLHEQAGPRLLRLTRLGLLLLWLFKLLLDPLSRLALLPRELFNPVGVIALLPATWLDWLLTVPGLDTLWYAAFFVLILGLTNRAFAVTSTLAAVVLTIYSSLIRGWGPAVHTDIVPLLSIYALAGFAWADLLTQHRGKRVPPAWSAYPIITIVALLCLSYCLVGLNRLIGGAPGVFTGDTMETWTVEASLSGYYFNTGVGWHVPEWPLVATMLKLGFPVITFFEITAPLCLVCARFRWMFIPVMLSFHLLSLVFMNIFFFDDMLLYLLLVDWSARFPSLRARS